MLRCTVCNTNCVRQSCSNVDHTSVREELHEDWYGCVLGPHVQVSGVSQRHAACSVSFDSPPISPLIALLLLQNILGGEAGEFMRVQKAASELSQPLPSQVIDLHQPSSRRTGSILHKYVDGPIDTCSECEG